MKKFYEVYEYGNLRARFEHKKDAIMFTDMIVDDGEIVEHNYYQSLEEIIVKNPKYFIEDCKRKLNILEKEVIVRGFISKNGVKGYRKFSLEKIKEIIVDGPKMLKCHIAGFWDEDKNEYNVGEKQFELFVKAYQNNEKNIDLIKNTIKYAEEIIQKKKLLKENKENTLSL